MYDNYQFRSAQCDLSYAIMHLPDKPTKRVEATFLRALLTTATKQGYIKQDDVQRAIESSGALELPEESRNDTIIWLRARGSDYIGGLSRQQLRYLRWFRHLCLRVAKGDIAARSQLAELI